MGYIDYYSFMGLSRDANQETIKHAYRRLAQRYHPDAGVTADAEDLFKKLGQAYGVLKDPHKRAMYDSYLSRQRTETNHSAKSQNANVNIRRSIIFVFGPIMLLIGALVAENSLTHLDIHALQKTLHPIDAETVVEKELIETDTLSATARRWR